MLKPSPVLNKISELPSLSIKNPIIPREDENMIIGVYDDSLIYTPLHHFNLGQLIQKYPFIWSGNLESRNMGEAYALVSKSTDNRATKDRIIEFIKITCLLIYLCNFYNIKRKVSIEVSDIYKIYVPTRYYKDIGGAWSCTSEIKLMLDTLLKGSLPKLLELPRSDLPKGVKLYFINNQAVNDMLTPYYLLEDKIKRFIFYDNGKAEILGLELKQLKNIIVPDDIQKMINLTEANNIISIYASNYEIAATYYVYLKTNLKEDIIYDTFLSRPLSIKTIRNIFWAPVMVTKALLENKILTSNHIVKGGSVQIGKTNFSKWVLTEEGLKIVKQFFGKGIKSTEFRVRPYGKAEIITDDIQTIELVKELIRKELVNLKLLEDSSNNLTFESDYFTIMKIYFTIKLVRGAILISEMNPLDHLIGEEALNQICSKTPFGDLHIIKIIKNGIMEIFLSSKTPEAISSLLFAVNEEVKFSIVLQEIEKGVLARKLTGSSIYYIFYALDKMSI